MAKPKVIIPPLSGGYMASTMLGYFISVIYLWKSSPPWGLAFSIAFAAMFISAVKSMTMAEPDMFVETEMRSKKSKKKGI